MKNNWIIKLVLFLTLFGTIGMFAIIPYSFATINASLTDPFIIMINTIFQIIFLLVLIGVRLQRRTGLGAPKLESLVYERTFPRFSGKWLFTGISVTCILSLIMIF